MILIEKRKNSREIGKHIEVETLNLNKCCRKSVDSGYIVLNQQIIFRAAV